MTNIPLYLAPLAGYSDQAFRRLCKDWQVDYLVSEMVSADGLIRDQDKTRAYVTFSEAERPYGVQIFGSDPAVMAKAAAALTAFNPDFIDINMGCPVRKVVKRGAGSALMKDPACAEEIVRQVKKAIPASMTLSVKFRSGWDSKSLNYLDFGLRMQDAGADIICLHPRTTAQVFSGQSNWEHIQKLKQAISIPLIGNGDVDSPESAAQMLKVAACDAIMIGRGALGRPWLFTQIKQYLAEGYYHPITKAQILDCALTHIDYALLYKEEYVVVREMRSQLCHYAKGMPGSKELREKINHSGSTQELRVHLRQWLSGKHGV
ncbi:MAG: tRNA dihydrouridine synthase DusB [Candidatus Cloacimonadaceae bacterium]|nr:tRNA dihydrouridine synthase DusB [Candidatus Cloacimonadota bacterium]MDY0128096.1 tRNA dihydrouridine synthase DusB [Candidatus Cloacimonadaceae bacterium]MCB5254054.1 tRNA dihydrouridine synthase DusB [Candidatus Cloacimonadota bacterium]MCK9178777.1 tRNA dihydrouridine synthase DusB [Candidatus Cloacimonadota bacterium]MCK9242449.1 tRNA dihydrouridine synthase DusB [Candidatus Cloacimonadota bacterium]